MRAKANPVATAATAKAFVRRMTNGIRGNRPQSRKAEKVEAAARHDDRTVAGNPYSSRSMVRTHRRIQGAQSMHRHQSRTTSLERLSVSCRRRPARERSRLIGCRRDGRSLTRLARTLWSPVRTAIAGLEDISAKASCGDRRDGYLRGSNPSRTTATPRQRAPGVQRVPRRGPLSAQSEGARPPTQYSWTVAG